MNFSANCICLAVVRVEVIWELVAPGVTVVAFWNTLKFGLPKFGRLSRLNS